MYLKKPLTKTFLDKALSKDSLIINVSSELFQTRSKMKHDATQKVRAMSKRS
ncbi:hypothetical protein HPHPP1_0769 [Helicobacter pylori Hp P-1]|nr:hypothetical protein HPHPP1_0769 [Helicobacter pylori Hp P-1]EJC20029.1 hypothetical protein HPHPP1B_0848 [Helicobacter pylori Hp P-1b]